MDSSIRICAHCRHIRNNPGVNVFSGENDAATPEILEAMVKNENEQTEIARLEEQKERAGHDFDFEPRFYAWCAKWTEQSNRFVLNPVTGEKSTIYTLCVRANADGQCALYEKK